MIMGSVPSSLIRLAFVLGSALGILFASPAAVFAQTYEGAQMIGFAESIRALGTSNDAIYVNPAGIALGGTYSLEIGYLDDFRGSDRRLNASIIDSQAGPVAAGLAYTYTRRRPDDLPEANERLEGHRAELALAGRVAETAAIGLSVRYLTFDRRDPFTEARNDDGFSALTLDAGLQWRIWQGLAIGLVGYNLTNSDRPELPISWGAGVGYLYDAFSIEADVRYNAQIGNPRYSLGAGYVVAQSFPVRAGVAYDRDTKEWDLSVGVGVALERIGIDIAYRQTVNPNGSASDRDARIFAAALRAIFF